MYANAFSLGDVVGILIEANPEEGSALIQAWRIQEQVDEHLE